MQFPPPLLALVWGQAGVGGVCEPGGGAGGNGAWGVWWMGVSGMGVGLTEERGQEVGADVNQGDPPQAPAAPRLAV